MGETELAEAHEQLHDLAAQAASSSAAKRKLESELQTLHVRRHLLCLTASFGNRFNEFVFVSSRPIWMRCSTKPRTAKRRPRRPWWTPPVWPTSCELSRNTPSLRRRCARLWNSKSRTCRCDWTSRRATP